MQKPTLDVKVKRREEGNGYVKVGLAIQKSNQILVVKVKQIEEGSGF